MEVPIEVHEAARDLIELYGFHFMYLGKYEGYDAFLFMFPEDTVTGFPFVYLYEQSQPVVEITGFEALHIINHFGLE